MPAQRELLAIVAFQFVKDLGQVSGLFADGDHAIEERRKGAAFRFHDILERIAGLEALGDPADDAAGGQRALATLLLEHIDQRQARPVPDAERLAQADQVVQGDAG